MQVAVESELGFLARVLHCDLDIAAKVQEQASPECLDLFLQVYQAEKSFQQRKLWVQLVPLLQSDYPSFAALILKVRPKGGGFIRPFVFNDGQKYVWNKMARLVEALRALWLIILKARQGAGMSTFCCGWEFFQLWRQPYIQTMTVAHQMKTAEHMIETMRVFHDNMPKAIRPPVRQGNKAESIPRGEIYFSDRNSWGIIQVASNLDPRGQQITHVHETETAMYPDLKKLNGALLPSLPGPGRPEFLRSSFIMESTPKGENDFYWAWQETKKKGSLWTGIMLEWYKMPDEFSLKAPKEWKMTEHEGLLQRAYSRRNEEDGCGRVTRDQMWWRRRAIEDLYNNDEDYFNQEYPSDDEECFLLQTKSIFKPYMKYVMQCVHQAEEMAIEGWRKYNGLEVKGPIRLLLKYGIRESWNQVWKGLTFDVNPHGNWQVWVPPVRGHQYVVSGDAATGLDDGDPSAMIVVDVTEGWQVAEYRGKLSPEKFADEMDAVGRWYNMALLIPEVNTIGYIVLSRLSVNLCYPNMYKWPKWDEAAATSNKKGWVTLAWTKPIMISRSVYVIEQKILRPASRMLMSEMTTFQRTESKDSNSDVQKFAAQSGYTDDLVICWGMAAMAAMQIFPQFMNPHDTDDMLPSTKQLMLSDARDPSPTQLDKQIKGHWTINTAQGKVIWAEDEPANPYRVDAEVTSWHGMLGNEAALEDFE